MNEPRRIAAPFVDQKTKDIVQAFFFDGGKPEWGGEYEPPTVVTIPAHAGDILLGKKDVQTGLWSQEEFGKRFKIAQA